MGQGETATQHSTFAHILRVTNTLWQEIHISVLTNFTGIPSVWRTLEGMSVTFVNITQNVYIKSNSTVDRNILHKVHVSRRQNSISYTA